MTVVMTIAKNTWRLAWRESLTRLELSMLALLTLLAAIATIGSPSAGDGAIQMYAVAYSIVPFSLVLIIGQLGRDPNAEVAWWSRAISRNQFLSGRFLGYAAVGAALVGIIAALGWILMTLIAHLAPLPGLRWTLAFALFTLPSLVTIIGGALWLQTAMPGGTRYFAPAILGSLIIAFAEYKLTAWGRAFPHIWFFNPFPGFLQLGLTLPPSLINPWTISGWLWLNRLIWTLIGGLLFLGAIRHRASPYPPRASRFIRNLLMVGSLAAAFVVIIQQVQARRLAPAANSGRGLATNFFCTTAHSQLAVNAQTGDITGHITCRASHGGILRFSMNGGLSLGGGGSLEGTAHASSGLAQGTAQRQWTFTTAGSHPQLQISVQGRLLPYPSTLPYPPFAASQIYSGVYAGGGKVYIANLGEDLPSFLSAASPIAVSIQRLTAWPLITNGQWDAGAKVWSGTLHDLVVSTGVTTLENTSGATVYVSPGTIFNRESFQPYLNALPALQFWLLLPRNIMFIPSPVTAAAGWHSPDLVYSDVHPYVRAHDPVSGAAVKPNDYTATLTLSRLFWQASPTPAILTALLIFSHTNQGYAARLLEQVNERYVPNVGPLSKSQVQWINGHWQQLRGIAAARQKQWLEGQYKRGRSS